MFKRAQLYSQVNDFQRQHAKHFLKKYEHVMKWKEDISCSLLDVGCGTGDVLFDYVVPLLPNHHSKIVGVDLSPKMVEFSTEAYGSDPKVTFEVMDIADDNLQIKEQFDHVTSIYCLNFIQNQRQAIKNIYNLLKTGGDAFLLLMGKLNIWYILDILTANPRWRPIIRDLSTYASPYRHCRKPDEDFRNVLEECGFKVQECEASEKKATYSKEKFIKFLRCIDKLIPGTPEDIYQEFFSEICDLMRELNLVEEVDGQVSFILKFKCLVAYVKKENIN